MKTEPFRCIEVMKMTREQAMSMAEIERETAWSKPAINKLVNEMEAQGLLVEKRGEKRAIKGPVPRLYKLSSRWGGL